MTLLTVRFIFQPMKDNLPTAVKPEAENSVITVLFCPLAQRQIRSFPASFQPTTTPMCDESGYSAKSPGLGQPLMLRSNFC